MTPAYIAFDPGGTTGWATFDEKGQFIDMGQLQGFEAVDDFLTALPNTIHTLIYERYMINPHIGHGGSKVPTIQIIGMLKSQARRQHLVIVEQGPEAKNLGYQFGDIKPPKDHKISHQYDAIAHGLYYLVTRNIVRIKL